MADLTDKKIIKLLNENSRMNLTKIANKLNLKTDKIKYRIDRMLKNKLIFNFKTSINYQKLGYNGNTIFFKLKEISKEIRINTIKKLNDDSFIIWVGTISGNFDFRINILSKNNLDLNNKISKLEKYLNYNVEKLIILPIINKISNKIFPISSYFSTKEEIKELKKINLKKINNNNNKMDEKDFKIIKELIENPKISFKEIANKLKVTSEDIRYRFKNISKTGIISKFTISLNPNKLKVLWLVLLIKIKTNDENLKFIKYLKNENKITTIHQYLGYWNFEITFVSKNIEDLDSLILNLKEKFNTNIIDLELLHIKDSLKNYRNITGIFKEL